MQREGIQTIAVTGGKGGVGKTVVAVSMATALAQAGQRVLLLDGDSGLASVDVHLGLTPRYTLEHLLNGEKTLEELLLQTREGVSVVPAASGIARLAALGPREHAVLMQAFATLPRSYDVLIIDCAPGIAEQVRRFSEAAQHLVVVLCDEPASLTDAYALIKVLMRERNLRRFKILVNKSQPGEGEALFKRLQRVTDRYLEVELQYLGEIPDDRMVQKSVREQRTVLSAYPGCAAAQALRRIAVQSRRWPSPRGPGRIELFLEHAYAMPERRLRVIK
jgi:flagellar biosynthesis protein FlhG